MKMKSQKCCCCTVAAINFGRKEGKRTQETDSLTFHFPKLALVLLHTSHTLFGGDLCAPAPKSAVSVYSHQDCRSSSRWLDWLLAEAFLRFVIVVAAAFHLPTWLVISSHHRFHYRCVGHSLLYFFFNFNGHIRFSILISHFGAESRISRRPPLAFETHLTRLSKLMSTHFKEEFFWNVESETLHRFVKRQYETQVEK